MENEVWKDIPGYTGYQASSLGNIRNKKTGNILNGVNNHGYLRVTIRNNKKKILIRKHRLIAKTFISNPENKSEVNHINGIKTDNRVCNLEWCNRKENAIHSINNGLQKTLKVGQYDKNMNLLKIYFNAERAKKETGINHINDCCNKKRKTAGGFIWKHIPKKD